MHRIDTANNVAGLFADPNPPAQGAVVCDSAWLNDVQENINAVIEGASIVLVKGTHTQLRDAIAAMVSGAASSASTTVAGIIMLATLAEVQALTVTNKAVTPATLGGLLASTSQLGILRLASDAEALAGTVTDKALTPSNLGDMAKSIASPGYCTLPGSGLLMQWGFYNGGSSNPSFAFPVSFSSQLLLLGATAVGTGASALAGVTDGPVKHVTVANGSYGLSGFSAWCSAENEIDDVFDASTTVKFFWFAIGK